jgi:hypothetical protein
MATITLPELLSWARKQFAESMAGFAIHHNPNPADKEEQEGGVGCAYQAATGLNTIFEGKNHVAHILRRATMIFLLPQMSNHAFLASSDEQSCFSCILI